MANTNERKTGPSKVDQARNTSDIIDDPKDIKSKEISEKDLDRGEELYTGFGFGNIIEPRKSHQARHATSTKYAEAESVENPLVEKQEAMPALEDDESLFVSNTRNPLGLGNEASPEPSPIEVPETKKLPKTKTLYEEKANRPEARGNWQVKNSEKIMEAMPVEKERPMAFESSLIGESSLPGSEYGLGNKSVGAHLAYTGLGEANASKQVPDYELSDVCYAYQRDKKDFYQPRNFAKNSYHVEVLPIKRHYKSLEKEKKKSAFPWAKIALGLSASLGVIGLIKHLTDKDDSGFFF